MIRVQDDRPGSHAAVTLARPGPLRVYAYVRAGTDTADLTGLRVLLIGDLLSRIAELSGLQVLTTWAFADEPTRKAAMEGATALGIIPPVLPDADLAQARLGGPGLVRIADDGATGKDDRSGVLIGVAAARLAQDASLGETAAGPLAGREPSAVRLALMALPRHESAELTSATLADAARTLDEWRRLVAGWAEFPSGAIPGPIATTIGAAFENLDVIAVLGLLKDLAANEAAAPGPRFETFVYADRVLGLDLPRGIGH